MPPTRVTLRQSVALVWRTLRSMRTALILLLLLALASVAGLAGAAVAELPGTGHPLPAGSPARRRPLRPARALRRLRVVVVRARHGPALRVARRLPRPAHPRGGPQPPRKSRCRRARSTRSVSTRSAWCPQTPRVSSTVRVTSCGDACSAWQGRRWPPGARGREGGAPGDREPALPLGVPVDRHRRRSTARAPGSPGRPSWWRARRGSTPRRTTTARSAPGGSSTGTSRGSGIHLRGFEDTYRRSGQPMDFVSHVDLLDPQGSLVERADIRVNHPRRSTDWTSTNTGSVGHRWSRSGRTAS